MINLLPYELKQDILYARRNSHLRSWIIASIISLAGVGIIVAGGLLFIQQSINNYTKQIDTAKQQLASQDMEGTQKRVAEISNNTKLTTQVLSREVLFSKLIKEIGSTLPAGTALQSLKIDSVQGAIELNAGANDFNNGTQIQLNLQDPKRGLFEKADINDITCGDDTAASVVGKTKFPCTVQLRALFKKDNNSFYFIQPTATGAKKQ